MSYRTPQQDSSYCRLLSYLHVIAFTIAFTPLKYYLPGVGYGNAKQIKEYRLLKLRTDSIEQSLLFKQKYIDDLQKILKGTVVKIDTNKLELPRVEVDLK